MKRAYTDIPEGQMHYRYAGSTGPPIVLVHMSGSSGDEFEQVGNILAEYGYRVFAPDLLGFGNSDCPPKFYYSLSEHAQTMLSFMNSIGLERALFYGNLAAANMVVHLGVDFPKRVDGLFLAHPLHSQDPVQYAQKRFLTEHSVVHPEEDGRHLKELWSRTYKYGESVAVCDARCRCMYLAGEWSETLHWALFEDTPLIQMLPCIKVPSVVAAYCSFKNPKLLEKVTSLSPHVTFDLFPSPDGTPYIARSHPAVVAEMIFKHFPSKNFKI